MFWLTVFLLPAVAPIDVSIEPLSGSKVTGVLVELDTQHVTIDVEGKRSSFDTRDLLTLAVGQAGATKVPDATVWIELIDGSRIEATRYTVQDRVASILAGDRTLSVETRNVRSVRYHPPSDTLDAQWREILEGKNAGDVIVLRRSKTALDQLEGVFHNVDEETIEFEYDDERIPVKREKLEGMVYFHPVVRDLPEAVCSVQETNGSTWRAKSFEWKADLLQVTSVGGIKYELPLAAVSRLDFSAGNVAYLSDLPFESVECTPFIGSRVSAKRILQLYQPRRDGSFAGSDLWVGEGSAIQTFEKGLSIHSRTVLTYRLADAFRKFTAVAGIDSRLRGAATWSW